MKHVIFQKIKGLSDNREKSFVAKNRFYTNPAVLSSAQKLAFYRKATLVKLQSNKSG